MIHRRDAMNGKLSRALAEIDESLINEAANADRAEHGALRIVRNIAIPLAAAAAVAAVAIAMQDYWKAAVSNSGTSGVSLIESGDGLLPSAPSWANADGQSRLGELLWNNESANSVGAVPICMDEQKTADTYFGSNFPSLVHVGEDITVFTDGIDGAVYFCDISEEDNGDRILYSIDLEATVLDSLSKIPELAYRYSKLGYFWGGETNGISVFAAEKNGQTGIFFNVASYDDEENRADDIYRIVYDIDTCSPVVIRAAQTGADGVPEPLDGWETRTVSLLYQPFLCEDGKTVTAMLESFDFSGFCLEIEENGEQRRIYPFKYETNIPDFRGEDADEAQAWLEENGYIVQRVYSEDDEVENGKVVSIQQNDNGTAIIKISAISLVFPLPQDSGCEVVNQTYADGGVCYDENGKAVCGFRSAEGHTGVDIAAEEGTPVLAAHSGTVTIAAELFPYGNYIMIEGGEGISTVYGHCSELYAKEGDSVNAGEKIAAVGATGTTSGSNLHFEVLKNDEPVPNPLENSFSYFSTDGDRKPVDVSENEQAAQTESGNLLAEMANEQLSELLGGCEEYDGNAEQQAQFPLGYGVDWALFTTYFGYNEWLGGTHYGVDIGNEGIAGKPVSAAYSGRVAAVNRFDPTNPDSLNRQYGSYVVLSHGNGVFTVYGQLDFVCVDEGDIMKQGAVIGTVGCTGFSSGAHLHFEVRNGRSAVNPLELSFAQHLAPESDDYIFPLSLDSDYAISETTYAEGGFYDHTGVDFAVKKGTPIHAAQSGTVVLSEYYYGGYGNCVMILHDDGRTTVYGHCDELLVSEGDVVEKGQNIATVGSTGYITGEHLHFEVRENDEPLAHPLSLIRFFP